MEGSSRSSMPVRLAGRARRESPPGEPAALVPPSPSSGDFGALKAGERTTRPHQPLKHLHLLPSAGEHRSHRRSHCSFPPGERAGFSQPTSGGSNIPWQAASCDPRGSLRKRSDCGCGLQRGKGPHLKILPAPSSLGATWKDR
ncbi:hypothetical protein NDU88_001106 [Pleurodeles waltl]|uniref:Uncharacterized protein n=1 Tax=Pleurodeles waltl TaxID=8319 RepID=A0AAV7N9V5_PLEWA|nr:hypothetical protein NDU88_001106 [Pleurodeles waltl]